MSTNIHWHDSRVTAQMRRDQFQHNGFTLWLTGLSGAGKSTIGFSLEHYFVAQGTHAYTLDGDNIRHGLNSDLGFSPEDRKENIRRIAEVAALFADSGDIAITSFISPYCADRDLARQLHAKHGIPFIEVYVNTPIDVCEKRDPKGLYKKARAGELKGFTGIDAPYEAPPQAELTVYPANCTVEECCEQILAYLRERGLLS